MSGYPSVDESDDMFELDASRAAEAVVDKFDGEVYKCKRRNDGGRIYVPVNGWFKCVIKISGQLYEGYSWVAPDSGNAYYTFSLESERKKGKKAT